MTLVVLDENGEGALERLKELDIMSKEGRRFLVEANRVVVGAGAASVLAVNLSRRGFEVKVTPVESEKGKENG